MTNKYLVILTLSVFYITTFAKPNLNAQSSLVGHWSFDEGVSNVAGDNSGNNNSGTLFNNPAWSSAGVVNDALCFDGIDDYVSISGSTSLDFTDELTIATWVRADATGFKPGSMILPDHRNTHWGAEPRR